VDLSQQRRRQMDVEIVLCPAVFLDAVFYFGREVRCWAFQSVSQSGSMTKKCKRDVDYHHHHDGISLLVMSPYSSKYYRSRYQVL